MTTTIDPRAAGITPSTEETDLELAVRLSTLAGQLLLAIQSDSRREGVPARALKVLGDRKSQEFMARVLTKYRPEDRVLSEEAADDSRRTTANRVWIIDPLDGTREYSEGRMDWAVHVALWQSGRLRAGAVALPGLLSTLDSGPGGEVPPRRTGPLRFAVSRTRPSQLVSELATFFGAMLVPMGSAGFKAGAVIRGEVDAYVHSGGQYEWDSAAPVAVARSHGLHASRIDGRELRYNQPDPYLPDLLLCRPELASNLLRGIRKLGAEALS